MTRSSLARFSGIWDRGWADGGRMINAALPIACRFVITCTGGNTVEALYWFARRTRLVGGEWKLSGKLVEDKVIFNYLDSRGNERKISLKMSSDGMHISAEYSFFGGQWRGTLTKRQSNSN